MYVIIVLCSIIIMLLDSTGQKVINHSIIDWLFITWKVVLSSVKVVLSSVTWRLYCLLSLEEKVVIVFYHLKVCIVFCHLKVVFIVFCHLKVVFFSWKVIVFHLSLEGCIVFYHLKVVLSSITWRLYCLLSLEGCIVFYHLKVVFSSVTWWLYCLLSLEGCNCCLYLSWKVVLSSVNEGCIVFS